MGEVKRISTEAGMIPKDWDIGTLGEAFSNIEAGVSVNSDERLASEFYVLKTSAVHDGIVDAKESKPVLTSDYHRLKCPLQRDSIVISRMNTPELVGAVGYNADEQKNFFLPDRLWQIINDNEGVYDYRWLVYLLNLPRFRAAVRSTATGTSNSMKNISKDRLKEITIPKPSIFEQKEIADAITTVDELIETLEELITKKTNILTGARQSLLSGRERLDGFNSDWIEGRLDEFVIINPSSSDPFPEEFVYIDLESVSNGMMVGRIETIKREQAPSRAQRLFEYGDTLYQTVRPYQRNNLYVTFDAKCYVASTGYAVIRPIEGKATSKYVSQFVYCDQFVKNVLDACTGTGYPAISPKALKGIEVTVPSDCKEQEAIAELLFDMESEIFKLKAVHKKYRKIRSGMMDELLTGKIRLV